MKQNVIYESPESRGVYVDSVTPICASDYCNTITDVVVENVEW